jgi:hypothetical protein
MPVIKIPDARELNDVECSCGDECCGGAGATPAAPNHIETDSFAVGRVSTPAGDVPVVASRLSGRDRRGALRVRLGIGRGRYAIAPGLYALGRPDPWSPVLVSANYKLSFDRLRRAVPGLNAWILVLDTAGINVWCAAGKGTFGTEEVERRIEMSGLKKAVAHRTLILPQLGAPGVSSPEVAKRTGFRVLFGPVRAEDLPAFLEAGMKADPKMRRVRFAAKDRLILVPVELSGIVSSKVFLGLALLLSAGMLAGFEAARFAGLALGAAIFTGSVLTPLLLPWIPGRMFAAKGALLGLIGAAVLCASWGFRPAGASAALLWVSALLVCPALSAFLAMNFTGSSTFTSLSGVVAEMKVAVPLMLAAGGFGLAVLVLSIVLIP